jgi:5-methylcytosine-specific restriction endonuclease McrA
MCQLVDVDEQLGRCRQVQALILSLPYLPNTSDNLAWHDHSAGWHQRVSGREPDEVPKAVYLRDTSAAADTACLCHRADQQ